MIKKKLKFWNIPVTAHLDECVETAVRANSYVSKSDFVREAVREKLEILDLLQKESNSKEVPKS
jgi:Arc/MetJ-type ribon-helix-helix transcriptional regulator